jgi:hypothetical protein
LLQGRHSGRRCFVIGNGPSLAAQDISWLSDEITFATNAFQLHPILERWQPTYYCIIDPVCFDRSPAADDYLRVIRSRAMLSTFFVPLYFYKPLPTPALVLDDLLLPPDRTHFVALGGDISLTPVTELDPARLLPPLLNVAQVCLALAIYMGCSPVYLLGMDHDWLARPGAKLHFYEERTDLEIRVLPTNPLLSDYRLHVSAIQRVWRGYELLADAACQRGVCILNATKGGALDVFPRVDFEALAHSAAPITPARQ